MQQNDKPEDLHIKEFRNEPEKALDAYVDQPDTLQRDRHGFVLVPQPSCFKDDPLVYIILIYFISFLLLLTWSLQNWPSWLKWLVLLQVSFLAMLGPFNSAVINPVLVPLAEHFQIPSAHASYQTTTVIIVVGISPLFWTPLANVYGRRPVYLVSTFIGIIATFGTGLANTWATLIVGRVFSGIGVGAAMALGAATVNDMFFLHEVSTFQTCHHFVSVVSNNVITEGDKNGRLDRLPHEYDQPYSVSFNPSLTCTIRWCSCRSSNCQ